MNGDTLDSIGSLLSRLYRLRGDNPVKTSLELVRLTEKLSY